ncbi:MAG TPA: carboxypeptidase-like regulatory domain-containing protein, partial [Terriglobales bacterium]|nr:carboxypeptidase-like regulatory domain-containing protein [Terriglobales bacterium]
MASLDRRPADAPDAPDAPNTAISGTVTDADGDLVPGAAVALVDDRAADRRSTTANDNAFFEFTGVRPGNAYHLEVSAPGFDPWISSNVTLSPGQFFDVTGIKLKLTGAV